MASTITEEDTSSAAIMMSERRAIGDPIHCLPYRLKTHVFEFNLEPALPELAQNNADIVRQVSRQVQGIHQPVIEFLRLTEGIQLLGKDFLGIGPTEVHQVEVGIK